MNEEHLAHRNRIEYQERHKNLPYQKSRQVSNPPTELDDNQLILRSQQTQLTFDYEGKDKEKRELL